MSLEEQVDVDFSRARRRAFLRRVLAGLRRCPTPNRLSCFEEVRKKLRTVGRVQLRLRAVRVKQIVGSVGRCSEFDPTFLPLGESARTKWELIDRAFHRGEDLPPVKLYNVGSSYFALDGIHRVSVARYHGVEFIDAEVTEFAIPSSPELTHSATFDDLAGREDMRMDEILNPRGAIRVRWGLEEDEEGIAELMDLNGMCRTLAFEERFIVAVRDGKVLAVLRYRTEPERLLLGLLVSDP